ncbi:MAG: dethiobiotin synthase [Phycisphaerae bacterium]|nr:dethiobiotin synthase [Phycisphaerae bacterium]
MSGYPPLPRLAGLLVTGTDTEVGKTLIAGAIARSLRRRGRSVEVFKPVATGCRHAREGLISADAEFLAVCADSRRTLAEITPVRYAAALAPNVAAAREHRPVDLAAVFEAYRRLAGAAEAVIVEGVGGLLCPITDDFWGVHLARLLALPVVIVARAGLGTINHTLLTLHAARSAGLEVAGVIVNRYRLELAAARELTDPAQPYTRGDADLAIHTNPAQIADRGRAAVLAIVPEEDASSVERATIGENTQFAIDQVDWERILHLT